jgi:hypothetical protein
VCRDFVLASITQVKCQCVVTVKMLVTKLEKHLMDSQLINALSIVYLQFWMQPNAKFLFLYILVSSRDTKLKRLKPSLDQVAKPFEC